MFSQIKEKKLSIKISIFFRNKTILQTENNQEDRNI